VKNVKELLHFSGFSAELWCFLRSLERFLERMGKTQYRE
jgi:hypothetical protein